MPILKQLRAFNLTVPDTHTGLTFSSQCVAASTNRLYVLGNYQRAQVVASFSLDGTLIPSELFTLPRLSNLYGMTLVGERIYFMQLGKVSHSDGTVSWGRVWTFTLAGVSQDGFFLAAESSSSVLPPPNLLRYDARHARPRGLAYSPERDLFFVGGFVGAVNSGGVPLEGFGTRPFFIVSYSRTGDYVSSERVSSPLRNFYALEVSDRYVYATDDSSRSNVSAYSLHLVSHPEESLSVSGLGPGSPIVGLAWTGTELFFHWSGRVRVFGYTTRPVVEPVLPAPFQQFARIPDKWIQRFDVLRLTGSLGVEVVALNVEAVQQSSTQFVNVGSGVSVQDQLRNVTWIPRETLPGLRVGDFIVPAQGLTAAQVVQVPDVGRLTVEGVSSAAGITQQVVAKRSLT